MMRIKIASVPDREKLVAELWYGEEISAPLSRELADELRLRSKLSNEENKKRGPLNLKDIPQSSSAQWAELNQENGKLNLEIYPNPEGRPWTFSFQEALEALIEAKKKLLEE